MRPLCLPRAASRSVRRSVEPGSSEYSAVTQPRPLPLRKRGTLSSSLTVHSTLVRPISQSTDASGFSVKSTCIESGRSSIGRATVVAHQGPPFAVGRAGTPRRAS